MMCTVVAAAAQEKGLHTRLGLGRHHQGDGLQVVCPLAQHIADAVCVHVGLQQTMQLLIPWVQTMRLTSRPVAARQTNGAMSTSGCPDSRCQLTFTMCTEGSGCRSRSLGSKRSLMKVSAWCSSWLYAMGSCCGKKSTCNCINAVTGQHIPIGSQCAHVKKCAGAHWRGAIALCLLLPGHDPQEMNFVTCMAESLSGAMP